MKAGLCESNALEGNVCHARSDRTEDGLTIGIRHYRTVRRNQRQTDADHFLRISDQTQVHAKLWQKKGQLFYLDAFRNTEHRELGRPFFHD